MKTAAEIRRGTVAVVGAGIAGLACAIALAARHVPVVLLEAADAPGGKMRTVAAGGRPQDAGPTVFTMRHVFERLFADAGSNLADHVTLRPAEVLARHWWKGSPPLDLHASREASAQAIRDFAGAPSAAGYVRFCRDAGRIFAALERSFIGAQRPGPVGLAWRVARQNPADLARLSPFATLWSRLGDYFPDVRLRQLFARYATYVGSSPFSAPATLMLIAHVEQEGVWLVDGGMHALAQAMAGLASSLGVEIRHGARVDAMARDRHGFALALADGNRIRAERVVWCGDVSALAGGLAGPMPIGIRPVSQRDRSLSAIVWSMLAETGGLPLARHTVFFSDDYRAEFDAIFLRRQVPDRPTVYVCAHDRSAAGALPAGQKDERLYMLINAPTDGDTQNLAADRMEQCLENTCNQLAACGLTLTPRGTMVATAPSDWNRMFPASGGALYGRASHGWMASFARPGPRTAMAGLYLAGGSVHPGPGVPMAAMSGMLAAESLISDRRSTQA